MADNLTREDRSKIMFRIKDRDTKPEMLVRRILHRMGYRFRLHRNDLPGKPDIVLPRHKKVILVHGCFWHGHIGYKRAARPTSNADFWDTKLNRNMERDQRTLEALYEKGWQVLTVWQCQMRDLNASQDKLQEFMA